MGARAGAAATKVVTKSLLPRTVKPRPSHRRNEPMYLPHICRELARDRDEDVEAPPRPPRGRSSDCRRRRSAPLDTPSTPPGHRRMR
jgi:hypothetical protein